MIERLIKEPDVLDRIGNKRAWLAKMVSSGDFPAPVKVGRKNRWLESEVDGWIRNLAASQGKVAA